MTDLEMILVGLLWSAPASLYSHALGHRLARYELAIALNQAGAFGPDAGRGWRWVTNR